MKNAKKISVVRWTARIIGTVFVALTLFIGIGEMLEGYNKEGAAASDTFDAFMIITFIFWGVGLAGLILALWKEGLGGIISLFGFIVFLILVGTNPKPDVRFINVLFVFLIPSVLYIYCWWLTKKSSNKIL